MYYCWFDGFLGLGGWVVILFCMAMFILVIYLAVRVYYLKKGIFDRRDSLIILRRRLASGEISIEEYEALKKVL